MDENEKPKLAVIDSGDYDTRIPSLDMRKCYTLGELQRLFIMATDPVPKFAERYNVSQALVERFVREGRWAELREAHSLEALDSFQKGMTATTEDSLDIQLKIQNMKNLQLEQDVQGLAKHYAQYGHLYAIDVRSGDILRDPYGFPMKLRVPDGPKASLELLSNLHSKLKELQEQTESKKDKTKFDSARPVDLTPFQHLLEPEKPTDE